MKADDDRSSLPVLPALPAGARRDLACVLESDLGFDPELALARFQSTLVAGRRSAAVLRPPRRMARTLLLAAALLTLISVAVALAGRFGGNRVDEPLGAVNGANHLPAGPVTRQPGAEQGFVAVQSPAPRSPAIEQEALALEQSQRPARGKPSLVGSARPSQGTSSSLEAETQHLAQLRKVASTDPARALVLCDEGDRAFRAGVFGVEREAIRIIALDQTGRRAQAATRAAQFLERYPRGPLAQRLQAIANAP